MKTKINTVRLGNYTAAEKFARKVEETVGFELIRGGLVAFRPDGIHFQPEVNAERPYAVSYFIRLAR